VIDVCDRKLRAFGAGMESDTGRHASSALQRNVQTGHGILAECITHGCLDSQEHAEGGVRSRIAADVTCRVRQTGHELRGSPHLDHVGHVDPDILGRDVPAAEFIHGPAECVEHAGSLRALLIGEDHGLAAAERKSGHCVLVAHSTREPEGVDERFLVLRVMPEPATTGRRTEMRRMNGDDRPQAAFVVGDEVDRFMLVEVGQAPGRGH
jgi:hypothetical protein